MKAIFELYKAVSEAVKLVQIRKRQLTDIKQSRWCDACDVKDAEIELVRAQAALLVAERDAMSHPDYCPDELSEHMVYNCSCGSCSVCWQRYEDFNRAYD